MNNIIASVLNDNTNLVEVYKGSIIDSGAPFSSPSLGSAVFSVSRRNDMFPNNPGVKLVEYVYKDITYIYDTTDDAQKVLRKVPLSCVDTDAYCVCTFIEETLPCHRFPCTNDIDIKRMIIRKTQRINNRISVVQDTIDDVHTAYVVYRHCPSTDINVLQDLDRAVSKL